MKPTRWDIREILRQRVRREGAFERRSVVIDGYTIGVDDDESPAVSGRNKYVWFRENGMNGAVRQVFNPDKIPMLVNFPCQATHTLRPPYKWSIVDVDWDKIINYPDFVGQNFGVGTHHQNHEWKDYSPGTDVMSVYPRMLAPLRTYSGVGIAVNIWAHRYSYDGEIVYFNGVANLDLSPYQPASGYAVRLLVYLDKSTNIPQVATGATVPDSLTMPPDPDIPENVILSAFVRLDGDQTSIAETDIFDLRMTLAETFVKQAAGGSSSIGASLNDLAKVAGDVDNTITHLVMDGLAGGGGGAGDVTGPGSSTDNAIARWDGAGGDTLQDSPALVSDAGVISTEANDAINNAVTTLLQLIHNTTGSPAAGIGAALEMLAETSTTEGQSLGQLIMSWAITTHASREAQFRLLLNRAGTAYETMVARMNPYGGTAIGNARGEGAFDFQTYRDSADQVASGEFSGVFAGASNKNAGSNAVIIGGDSNEITSDGWVAAILGGTGVIADKRSQVASNGSVFSAFGDAQGTIQMVAIRQVTHSTTNWYELFLNGVTQRMTIATDTAWTFDILLVGATSGLGKTFGFRIDGVIENDGGTTTLLASNVSTLYDTDDTSFDARVRGDDTNDALVIEVTDADGGSDTVRWVATIRTAELTYA